MILKTFYDMPMQEFLHEIQGIALDVMFFSFCIVGVFGSLALLVRIMDYVRSKI